MMALSKTQRWMVLVTALVLTLAAVRWVSADAESTDVIEVVAPAHASIAPANRQRAAQTSEAPNDIQLERLRRRDTGSNVREIFTAKSWYVPPPPPKPAAELPPSAPPLPFVYIGKMVEEEKVTVFLSKQDRNYTVKEGDVIDGTYRISSIKGTLMELTYIPLDIRQTMQIGEHN
ncbi:hypothetical protein [Noviherbaspirillum massiliense]|uniref:hypothetical protein n=1 Tax=Noviherbaspirillum massiliense TaxID=1465823 RepID=UPI0002FFE963|nr:hypothetical protein [Noviherbaspirillum massiliense]